MRIGWIGFHAEGIPALRALVECQAPLEVVVSLRPEAAAPRSGAADYRTLCRSLRLPLHEVDNINHDSSVEFLSRSELDLVFVIGWTQILKPEVLRLARVGMIGAHASLLPADRGRAPINWSLIKDAQMTGNTLLWLSDGVDAGDIIDQTLIPISPYDTCASIYRQVAVANRDMILRTLPRLLAGERPGRAQAIESGDLLPARRPADGLIDWTRPSREVYNFVRALTRPYPGAFTYAGDERVTIWKSALLPDLPIAATSGRAQPGAVLGPVRCPDQRACGQVIACGDGAVVLLEIQNDAGVVIRGRALSDLHWTGQVLGRPVEWPRHRSS
jgi:methionyl-tRNA formyltransferase